MHIALQDLVVEAINVRHMPAGRTGAQFFWRWEFALPNPAPDGVPRHPVVISNLYVCPKHALSLYIGVFRVRTRDMVGKRKRGAGRVIEGFLQLDENF